MTKLKKNYANLSPVELDHEAKKLRAQVVKAQAELAVGKLKNTRTVFNLRKALAVVLTYANNHR